MLLLRSAKKLNLVFCYKCVSLACNLSSIESSKPDMKVKFFALFCSIIHLSEERNLHDPYCIRNIGCDTEFQDMILGVSFSFQCHRATLCQISVTLFFRYRAQNIVTKVLNVNTSHGGHKDFSIRFVCFIKIAHNWTLIVTIVMLDQEVTGVQEEGVLREKIKNYLCYSLILGLVVIPEKINR